MNSDCQLRLQFVALAHYGDSKPNSSRKFTNFHGGSPFLLILNLSLHVKPRQVKLNTYWCRRFGLENDSQNAHTHRMATDQKSSYLTAPNIAVVIGTVLFCCILLFFVSK